MLGHEGGNMILSAYYYANKRGIPRLEANNVTVSTDAVTFNFTEHNYLNVPYSGLVLFKLPSYTAPSTAVPIVFNTNGKTQNLTTLGGDSVTSSDLNKSGIYLAYYENSVLQLL